MQVRPLTAARTQDNQRQMCQGAVLEVGIDEFDVMQMSNLGCSCHRLQRRVRICVSGRRVCCGSVIWGGYVTEHDVDYGND